jgi:long-chain acyl-CoA synthetase
MVGHPEIQTAQTSTLIDFIEGLAKRHGSRPALMIELGFRYQRWTYAQIWEQSGRVASLLQEMGLAKGDRALIWGPNSPHWVLAFFGCLRAGVIAVSLNMRSAEEFVRTVADKTSPKVAFLSRVTPRGNTELGVPELSLDDLEITIRDRPGPGLVAVEESDLVEIMFTSGTTGVPKGVMLTHRNLVSNVEAASQFVSVNPSDRLLSILPLSHMFEQMGRLLIMLKTGANVTYATSYQPSVLFKTMKERKVTIMLLAPQILDLFIKGIEREVSRQSKEGFWNLAMKFAGRLPFPLRRRIFRKVHDQMGGALKTIVVGGAPLPADLGARWGALGVNVIQGYGATEASPCITFHTFENPRYDSAGLPLSGVDVKIAHDGEVLVRGPNITPSYWETPDRTAEVFVDGWYRTGDQGSFDEDGFLHLNGRKKDMIVLASGQKCILKMSKLH